MRGSHSPLGYEPVHQYLGDAMDGRTETIEVAPSDEEIPLALFGPDV